MKVLYLLLLLSLCWLSSWGLQNVYITPDGNCSTANGTVLEPCYTLTQLGNLSPYLQESSVALLFLPGTHMLQEQLGIGRFEQVVMSPVTVDDKVVINCSLISSQNILIGNHSLSTITSIYFISCNLLFFGNVTVDITKSTFKKSSYRALVFLCAVDCGTSNVNIANCQFLSNVEGITGMKGFLQQNLLQLGAPNVINIANSLFQDNGADDGRSVLFLFQYVVNVINTRFIQNTIEVIEAHSSTLNLVNATFYSNHGDLGSAIYLGRDSRGLNVTNCSFVDNSAKGNGVIFLEMGRKEYSITNSRFQGNVARQMGGAIYVRRFSSDTIQLSIRDCYFMNNSAVQGGALWLYGSLEEIDINMNSFISNKAEQGGAVYSMADVSFADDIFVSNSATSKGGAVYLSHSTFRGINVTFSCNTANKGGAMYAENSNFITARNIKVVDNIAHDKGGAMFVSNERCATSLLLCTPAVSHTTQCDPYNVCRIEVIETTFINNSASHGQILYGGLLDRCFVDGTPGIVYFKKYSHYDDTVKSAISSDPVRVCLCNENSEVDCATRNVTVNKQRGQTINLIGVVVDQDSKAKEGFITAKYVDFKAVLGEGEDRQLTGDNCTDMPFHLFPHNDSVVQLVLRPEGICEQSDFSMITVDINIIPCTTGFVRNYDRCVCDPRLSDYVTSCDIDTQTIKAKESRIWVHYDEKFLKVHRNCPLDYCREYLTINLSSQDDQCANHHSGVICGGCQENYSIALGGSKCFDCSSSIAYAWLIPVFAVAGIALVALLCVCNMTISHGTLNGLIFYANIVSISRLTNFQDCSVHPLLSVFIAWVNLDFGIETCFYPGMDAYQKTWLQFAFPLYLWILVGAIIWVSYYSTRAVKVFGKNNIAILATLFLLSYTKLLKTIITALNVTPVLHGSAGSTTDPLVPYNVWVYDGNIEYLTGKHVPLFAVALAFLIFLFLPYTLLLTFGQYIHSIRTRNKCVLWCIRSTTFVSFISMMDAYYAPYTNRCRYWTGFMLLLRCVIFLSFTFSFHHFFSSMFIVLACLLVVFTLRAIIGKVYNNSFFSLLELTFLLNLAILSATVSYLRSNGGSDDILCTCTNASVSISLAMFIAILAYHVYIKISSQIECNKTIKDLFLNKWHFKQHYNHVMLVENNESPKVMQRPNAPTRSVVELREKLLESAK